MQVDRDYMIRILRQQRAELLELKNRVETNRDRAFMTEEEKAVSRALVDNYLLANALGYNIVLEESIPKIKREKKGVA